MRRRPRRLFRVMRCLEYLSSGEKRAKKEGLANAGAQGILYKDVQPADGVHIMQRMVFETFSSYGIPGCAEYTGRPSPNDFLRV